MTVVLILLVLALSIEVEVRFATKRDLETAKLKAKPGRRKGSKNKPKDAPLLDEQEGPTDGYELAL